VPHSSESRIEELCERIRSLCNGPFSGQTEAELRKLARQLRSAIREHVDAAKFSLDVRKKAILERDPDHQ
jgi:hypothetical protein